VFETQTLDGGQCLLSVFGCLIHAEIKHGTHWTAGWVRLIAGLKAVEKKKIICTCWDSNHG